MQINCPPAPELQLKTLTPWKQLMISRCSVSPRKCADKSQHPCLKLIKAMREGAFKHWCRTGAGQHTA